MPACEEVYQEGGEEVAFLGLAVADRTDDARDLVERTGVTYPTALDQQGEVIDGLGGTMLPTTVLLDADGETITSNSGALDADELRQRLAEQDRKSVVGGKRVSGRVDLGGRRSIKKKRKQIEQKKKKK